MQQYLELLSHVLDQGVHKKNRTGTDQVGVFGWQMRFNLQHGFPLVTTKKVFWRGVIEELFWMIRGETNVRSLQEKGIRIWDEWARADGDLGPVYGKQWRRWQAGVALQNTDYGNTPIGEIPLTPQFRSVEIDQLKTAVERIKADPDSRRNIVTAWNPAEIPEMALPPCHCFFQFYVAEGRVSCQMYQRSADLFLGVPFNIASYALLTHLVAHATGLEVGTFVHTLGDAHIYVNHVEQVKEQLRRAPKNLPSLHIAPDAPRDLFALGPEHVALAGYESHPPLYGEVAV